MAETATHDRPTRPSGPAPAPATAPSTAAPAARGEESGEAGSEGRPLAPAERLVDVPIGTLQETVMKALRRAGSPAGTARRLARDLVANELDGYRDHGLQQVTGTVATLRAGTVQPGTRPRVEALSERSWRIDAHGCFAHDAGAAVAETLVEGARAQGMACVSLHTDSPLGRLAAIAGPVAEAGLVVLGFSNATGDAGRVVPHGGREGRLGSNPVVFAAPAGRVPRPESDATGTLATNPNGNGAGSASRGGFGASRRSAGANGASESNGYDGHGRNGHGRNGHGLVGAGSTAWPLHRDDGSILHGPPRPGDSLGRDDLQLDDVPGPVIVDVTTSSASGAEVRDRVARQEPVPEGWLVHRDGRPSRHGAGVLDDPPSTFLGPLGGPGLGRKGFGLGLMVEILAGVLTGAGFGGSGSDGRGAFFVALSPEVAGRDEAAVRADVTRLARHLIDAGEGSRVCIPGWGAGLRRRKAVLDGAMAVPTELWAQVLRLAEPGRDEAPRSERRPAPPTLTTAEVAARWRDLPHRGRPSTARRIAPVPAESSSPLAPAAASRTRRRRAPAHRHPPERGGSATVGGGNGGPATSEGGAPTGPPMAAKPRH